jgi:hypothetical protein
MGHETDGEQELSVRLPIYTASANTETTSRYRIIGFARKLHCTEVMITRPDILKAS